MSEILHLTFLKAVRSSDIELLKSTAVALLRLAKDHLGKIAASESSVTNKQIEEFVHAIFRTKVGTVMSFDEQSDLIVYHGSTLTDIVNTMTKFAKDCKATSAEDVMVTIRRFMYAEMVIMDNSMHTDIRWTFDDALVEAH